MKKRIVSMLLVLAVMLSFVPAVFAAEVTASGTCGENVTWVLTDDGTVTISGTGKMTDYTDWGSPWYDLRDSIKAVEIEYGVTGIGDNAFSWCVNVERVSIPDSVTTIGKRAFHQTNLKCVVLPNSVTSLGAQAFGDCYALTTVFFEGSAPKFGTYVFNYDTITAYYPIGDDTWTLDVRGNHGGTVNWGNYSLLDSGTCGKGLYWFLFNNGKMLIAGSGEMDDCSGGTAPWEGRKDKIETLEVKRGVTSIAGNAFRECVNLTEVKLPESINYIGANAFAMCSSLNYVDSSGGVIFVDGSQTADETVGVQSGAFAFCSNLTSVTVPGDITSIGNGAFLDCQKLESITLFDNVLRISGEAFRNCSSLKDIEFPDYLTSIGTNAFVSCYGLTEITIPENVAEIGDTAFADCTNLGTITFKGNAPKLGLNVFYYDTLDAHYPAANSTWTADVMQNYGGTVTWVPDGFIDVPANAWFADEVQWAVDNGITNGMGDGTFAPDATCTRNQVVTFLWRAEGCPEPTSAYNPFVDVNETDYFYKAVLWAVENGITTGMDETHFGSEEECTRAQVVTFLHRAAGNPPPFSTDNPFSDVGEAYYTTPILWAVGAAITTGMGDGKFEPDTTCTRAQIVTFLYRAYR